MPNKTRVLILGGGFGGLYAALEFEKRRDPQFEVTVVNRENFFLFTPMLHEIAASDLDLTNIARRRDSTAQSVDRTSRRSRYGMRAGGTPASVDLCRCGRRLRRSRNHREHQRFPARRASVLSEPKRGNAPSRTRASGGVHFAGAWRETRPVCR